MENLSFHPIDVQRRVKFNLFQKSNRKKRREKREIVSVTKSQPVIAFGFKEALKLCKTHLGCRHEPRRPSMSMTDTNPLPSTFLKTPFLHYIIVFQCLPARWRFRHAGQVLVGIVFQLWEGQGLEVEPS